MINSRVLFVPALVVLAAGLLPSARAATPKKTHEPNWASLDARPTPAWFLDAKFGVFIHRGQRAAGTVTGRSRRQHPTVTDP